MHSNFKDPPLQLPDDQQGIGQEAWAYLSSEEDPGVQRLMGQRVLCR